jgi:hypothetical protein
LYVEDSGPGIPHAKRQKLFDKFQASLDLLSQGTGIGLCLCYNLIGLLNGEIYLDENYDSGVEGARGTRFVIKLNCPPLQLRDLGISRDFSDANVTHSSAQSGASECEVLTDTSIEDQAGSVELPERLNIMFVDE